jgi:hypothetical protein
MEVYIILICFNVLDYNVAVFKNFLVRAAGKALGMKSRPRAECHHQEEEKKQQHPTSCVCDNKRQVSKGVREAFKP